ncbi:tetratricopeptide repeat protein [Caldimonas brevitalea]|nr:tetratricopeptide repeat protein [Caldimonas brevitalea]
MSEQLPEALHKQISSLCAEGDRLARDGQLDLAKGTYVQALKLLPQDHRRWEAATWIYVAIGDVHFRLGNFDKALMAFINAVQCPGGLGNPFVHLRLGQSYYEDGNLEKAADELTRAYMGGGMGIFLEDDPKYLAFLETKIEI